MKPLILRSIKTFQIAAGVVIGLIGLVVLANASGCSKGPTYAQATVRGNVTIDGKPVPHGTITFSPKGAGQGPVTGTAVEDGKFVCEHVPLGDHTVTFHAEAAEKTQIIDHANGGTHEVPVNILPARYSAGVPFTAKAGENEHDFALTTAQ